MKAHLHALVIDDSALVRRSVQAHLARLEGWTVTTASDGVMALDRVREVDPDVILLDLEMPRLDGLTFLKHLMATHPLPVVVCSAFADPGSEMAEAVLRAGARQIVAKPKLALKEFLEGSESDLASILRRAAEQGVPSTIRPPLVPGPSSSSAGSRPILLGASMGGPAALRQVLAEFPADAPACLVVQHMQGSFTHDFARRLDAAVAMEVREAEQGDTLEPGRVLIAPGERHLVLTMSRPGGPRLNLSDAPAVSGHRPSIDVLFRSAAQVLGASAVAALLTGMGRDGAEGLLSLRRAGARTFAQDAVGCTVFGMPGAAIAIGAAEQVVPLDALAAALLDASSRPLVGRTVRESANAGRL